MQRLFFPAALFAAVSLGLAQAPIGSSRPAVGTGTEPTVFAVQGVPTSKAGVPLAAAQPRLDELTFAEEPGAIWAAARTFKARFDAAGATFVPFLGAVAERNYPITFTLAQVRAGTMVLPFAGNAAPARDGDTIRLPRGTVCELYELTTLGMEQRFTFDRLPVRGELHLRIAVGTELACTATETGLAFGNQLGGARYGKAVAIDARGARIAVATEWREGGIELTVPAAFVARAELPLLIDPLVTVFVAEATTEAVSSPDVAYDVTNDRFLLVWERAYSSTDHDVWSELRTRNGNYVAGAWIDVSGDYWARPRVANNNLNDCFLVVAEKGLPWFATDVVGKICTASSPPMVGNEIWISPNDAYDHSEPDVGGDPVLLPPTHFCVVWQRQQDEFDWDILYQLVTTQGQVLLAPNLFLANDAGIETHPSISKSNGTEATPQHWTVVWEKLGASTSYDIRGAQVNWNGAITAPEFAIDTSNATDRRPSVSTRMDLANGNQWLVVYERTMTPTDRDLFGQLWTGTTRLSPATGVNLSALVGGGFQGQDQSMAAVDSDGCRFAVTWSELFQTSTTDLDVFAATFHVRLGQTLALSEGHVPIATSGRPEDGVQVTSLRSGGGPPVGYGLVLQDAGNNGDILGAFYDGMGSTAPSRLVIGCGGLGIDFAGPGALGTVMDFQLQGVTGVPFLAFGFPVSPLPLCPQCRIGLDQGTMSLMYGAQRSLTIPARGEFFGLVLGAQGADLLSAGGCPQQYRTSDRIDFTIR